MISPLVAGWGGDPPYPHGKDRRLPSQAAAFGLLSRKDGGFAFRADIVKTNKKGRIYRKRFERIRKVRKTLLTLEKKESIFHFNNFTHPITLGQIEARLTKVPLSKRSRDPGQAGKGMPPKWRSVPVSVSAGSSDKICRTVTYVERYRGNRQAEGQLDLQI